MAPAGEPMVERARAMMAGHTRERGNEFMAISSNSGRSREDYEARRISRRSARGTGCEPHPMIARAQPAGRDFMPFGLPTRVSHSDALRCRSQGLNAEPGNEQVSTGFAWHRLWIRAGPCG